MPQISLKISRKLVERVSNEIFWPLFWMSKFQLFHTGIRSQINEDF